MDGFDPYNFAANPEMWALSRRLPADQKLVLIGRAFAGKAANLLEWSGLDAARFGEAVAALYANGIFDAFEKVAWAHSSGERVSDEILNIAAGDAP